jgi:glycosyltransferase involved in cell wall biosynthesis
VPLNVLSVAYPLAPAGPDSVGGAEQILSALDRALVEAGHRSVVVAHEQSQVWGRLLGTRIPAGQITDEVRDRVRAEHQANIDRAIGQGPVDLIHLHGIDFDQYRLPAGIPAVVTLHLPPSWYPETIWRRRDVRFVCVSESQRRSCPPEARDAHVIANGVPIGRMVKRARRNFGLALGRICPEKNFHEALAAGTRAGIPVLLGGEVFPYPEHLRYFREEIQPRLRNGHRFLGPVTLRRKVRLLRAARCLLLPTLAPETSSLVAMEAMAEGTPVVAYPSGAVPEIVRDGVTGFLVSGVAQMAAAIGRLDQIEPGACREEAKARFSRERMNHEYLALYEAMVRAGGSRTGCRKDGAGVLCA